MTGFRNDRKEQNNESPVAAFPNVATTKHVHKHLGVWIKDKIGKDW